MKIPLEGESIKEVGSSKINRRIFRTIVRVRVNFCWTPSDSLPKFFVNGTSKSRITLVNNSSSQVGYQREIRF